MSKLRFRVFDFNTDALHITEWEDEQPRLAAQRVDSLRQQFPQGAISIQREGDLRKPNRVKTYRFRIDNNQGEIRFSKVVGESEYDEALNTVRERYPKATITPEVVT